MLKRILLFFALALVLAVGASGAAYYYFIVRPLPEVDGETIISGLNRPVRVVRDEWGVPHIFAQSKADLFMAQGFVHAQDRLFQMELFRRVAGGRLAEIFGEQVLEADRLLRTLGLYRAAQREMATYSSSDMAIGEAYAGGVNHFIETNRNNLPIEFRLLGFKPEPWQPIDSLAWAKAVALFGSVNWQEEIVRAILFRVLGLEKARDLLGRQPTDYPAIMEDFQERAESGAPIPISGPSLPIFQPASNNWVVAGWKSTSGFPLLANDMHLPVGIPSVWYEIHLRAEDLDVIGLSIPGLPLVLAGHNRRVAWGITFAMVDNQDLFVEKMNPNKAGQYLFGNEFREAREVVETINVKGRPPVSHRYWETHHGPLIRPLLPRARLYKKTLALCWRGFSPGDMLPAMLRLCLAENGADFKKAALEWSEPALNLVYADQDGRIGYVLAGKIPLRPRGTGMGPMPGWTGHDDWSGVIPRDRMPALEDPPEGFIATANNRIVGSDYPFYLSGDPMPGYRAARIKQVLDGHDRIGPDESRALQADLLSLQALTFIERSRDLEIRDPEALDLKNRLEDWDGRMSEDSVEAAIFAVAFHRLLENTFRDDLESTTDLLEGQGLTEVGPASYYIIHGPGLLLDLMRQPDSQWFDNLITPQREDLAVQFEKSLLEARDHLIAKLGPSPDQWTWGRLHQVEWRHPLGRVKPLNRLFNRGPFPGQGHYSTVWQSSYLPWKNFNYDGWTVSNRHIYDLSHWDLSLGSIVPGQSGMVGSPHYDDQMEIWREVRYHPLYYSKESVEDHAAHVLVLKPADAVD